jgi:integrase
MAVQHITKRTVDALATGKHHDYVWDSELPGFGVRVTASGFKAYVAQYRLPGLGRRGTVKRITLGSHGVLTPDEARKLARRELGKVAHGLDPAADRAARRGAQTVKEFGSAYFGDVKLRRKRTTAYEYERLWKKHVVPELGSKQVSSVSIQDVRRLHKSLAGTPYTANRLLAMLGAFFSFAAKEGVIKPHENPAHGTEHFAEAPRERFLTAEEFTRLGAALIRAERTGLPASPEYRKVAKSKETAKHRPKSADRPIPANPYAVAAIRLLALTGCRETEILSLKWEAVDLHRGYLRLADTKTGASVRALGSSAAAVLKALPKLEKNSYVLPGIKEGQHLGDVQRLWYAVRHAASLDDVRLHDLRHSFASVSATDGESMLVIKALLGHARISTTERYAHLGDDPVKRAADKASGEIARLLGVSTASP